MKKILIAMLSMMLSVPVMAQYGPRRPHYRPPVRHHYGYTTVAAPSYHSSPIDIYYGMRVGAAFSTVNSDDRYLDGGTMRTGLNVGAVVGFQVAPSAPVYFETGLSYIEKGGTGHVNGDKFTYSLNYLEVPFVLKYQLCVDDMFSVQPFLGGYVAAGIDGRIKDFGNRHAYSSFDDDGFKRFDAGIKVGCGLQYNFLYAEVGYDFGLSNISRDYFDTSRTGSLFATIGVNL